jgi:hypothetical protein
MMMILPERTAGLFGRLCIRVLDLKCFQGREPGYQIVVGIEISVQPVAKCTVGSVCFFQIGNCQGQDGAAAICAEIINGAGSGYFHALYELFVAIEVKTDGVQYTIIAFIEGPVCYAILFVNTGVVALAADTCDTCHYSGENESQNQVECFHVYIYLFFEIKIPHPRPGEIFTLSYGRDEGCKNLS